MAEFTFRGQWKRDQLPIIFATALHQFPTATLVVFDLSESPAEMNVLVPDDTAGAEAASKLVEHSIGALFPQAP